MTHPILNMIDELDSELSRVPNLAEATRLADCEAFALRERWNANAAKFWVARDAERNAR